MPERNQGPLCPIGSSRVLSQGPRDSANVIEDEDDLPLTMLGKKRSYFQFGYCFKPQIRRIAQRKIYPQKREKIYDMKYLKD